MTSSQDNPKPKGRKTAPLSPAEQRRRFEDAARELGCDASEERFNEALDVIGRHKRKGDLPESPSPSADD